MKGIAIKKNIVFKICSYSFKLSTRRITEWIVAIWEFLPFLQFKTSHRSFSVKKVFLVISQNSQKNTCAKVFFSLGLRLATLFKKWLWYKCFPVNLVKFLRTHFFYRTSLDECFWQFRFKEMMDNIKVQSNAVIIHFYQMLNSASQICLMNSNTRY